jgi:peptidoglycan/xylan/chitin deacetylase (PgdA/CDA1 family)
MYHVIGTAGPDTPNIDLWVSPTTFARQVRWLDRHGFHLVSLQEVYDYWHGAPLPRKPVVLSFDDGFRSDYRLAMPILARHDWGGTLNLALSHYPDELNRYRIRASSARTGSLTPIRSHTPTSQD